MSGHRLRHVSYRRQAAAGKNVSLDEVDAGLVLVVTLVGYRDLLKPDGQMQPDILQLLLNKAEELGFATYELIFVKHD